jgi:uncharacterized protein YbjT (DUF2867 family)
MILITGATGTTGQEVGRQIAVTGQTVRALVRNPEKAITLKELGIEVVSGDLDQPETLDKAFEGIDRAFLLPANTLRQVEQETNFIEAAKRADVKHLVKYSARGSALDAAAQVARWHAQTEKLVEESGIAYTHIRPIFFMQNFLGFAQSIATDGTFALPLGDAKVAITDIRDIAAVVVAALTEPGHEGKTYSPTGPEALSMTEVAETLSSVLGKPVTYIPETPENFKAGLVQLGLPEWYADDLVKLNLYNASPEGAMVTTVVQEVAKKEPISFAQFANKYAHVFKGN